MSFRPVKAEILVKPFHLRFKYDFFFWGRKYKTALSLYASIKAQLKYKR
jgi:hypothetical protein